MKYRVEERGIHYYDRVSGYHLLVDEVRPPARLLTKAPSLVSIALTNVCDLACAFCYAPKTKDYLPVELITDWCAQFDELGTFEIAFGGGEPTLHPGLVELCKRVWSETKLGISITTHGQRLDADICRALAGNISVVRVSVDGVTDTYSAIRGRSFSTIETNLTTALRYFPVAVNTVVNATTLPRLPELAEFLRRLGVCDWLLLPETNEGVFKLTSDHWTWLDAFVQEHSHHFQLGVTYEARPFLPDSPFLFEDEPEHDYVHISADGFLRQSSYGRGGVKLEGISIVTALDRLASSLIYSE